MVSGDVDVSGFLVTLLAVALGLAPSPEALQAEPISQDTMDQLLTLGMMVMLAALPVAAAYWLAPALVTFEQASAAEAIMAQPALHVAQSGRICPVSVRHGDTDAGRTADLWRGIHCGGAIVHAVSVCLLSGFGRPGPVQIDNAGWVE